MSIDKCLSKDSKKLMPLFNKDKRCSSKILLFLEGKEEFMTDRNMIQILANTLPGEYAIPKFLNKTN